MVRAWSAPTAQNMFVAFCCGNHDYENAAVTDRSKIGHAWRSDTVGAWSPENLAGRYASGIDLGSGDYAVWGGVYDDPLFPRSSANNFIRLQVGGRKILIIALEFFPRTAVLNWARAVHDQYFDHEVWATTHGYMDTLGRRCDRSGYGSGRYKLADAPTSNSGEQMWAGIGYFLGGVHSLATFRISNLRPLDQRWLGLATKRRRWRRGTDYATDILQYAGGGFQESVQRNKTRRHRGYSPLNAAPDLAGFL